jgi:hypothetical protein
MSTLKNQSGRKYSFQNLTQFSQGNSVLDAAASNTDFFFFGDIYVFLQLGWIGLFGNKWDFLNLENSDLQEVFLSKIK